MLGFLTNLDKVRRYLKAIEEGDANYVTSLFSPEAFVEQLPNRIYPQGMRAKASQIPEAWEKGRKIFSRQTYEIINEAETGDTVALEVLWTGMLAVVFGTLAAGGEMRCHSAIFIKFRAGQIIAQRNYDCLSLGSRVPLPRRTTKRPTTVL